MIQIRFLFWNIYKKNLIFPLVDLILENDIDVVALVETDKLDVREVISKLKECGGQMWKKQFVCPVDDVLLLSKSALTISVICEEYNYSTYKIKYNNDDILFNVVHLPSALYKEENARVIQALRISDYLRKKEEEFYSGSEYKSIVVGDFNLQPYSSGIAGYESFNATMSIKKAKEKSKKANRRTKMFYFNPTWKLMGENKNVQGSYYNTTDSQDKSIFWYSYDELLIRPFFIDNFNWDYFEIIEKTNNYNFIKNDIIDKKAYSDHLPIKFELL